MGFTTGNDFNVLQATDTAIVGAGEGNDRYLISGALIAANQSITISDALGNNTLQLVNGLSITSTRVTDSAILFNLNNGAVVTVLGADSFSYLIGGDTLTGVGGTTQDFNGFVTQTLGIASVPGAAAAPVTGNPIVIGESGGGGSTNSPVFSLSPSPTSEIRELDTGSENPGFVVSVDRNGQEGDLTVNVRIRESSPASATAGADFIEQVIPVTISAGANLASFSATVLGDTLSESSETFVVELVAGSQSAGSINATASTTTVTIIDNDAGNAGTVTVTAGAASVDEGNTAVFNVATTNVADGTSFTYTITGADALDIAGGLAGSFTVTNNAASVPIGVSADGTTEGAETLVFTVDGQNASASTIVNDTSTEGGNTNGPVFSLSPSPTAETGELDTENQSAGFVVSVDRNGQAGDLTVNVRITESSPGSATAGVDFIEQVIPVTIFDGANLASFGATVLGDTLSESSETFVVELVAGSQSVGSISTVASTTTVTIIDNDTTSSSTSIIQPTNQPTAQEQFMLELLNRARLNPEAEAASFNIDLNEGLTAGTLPSDARQPVAFNNILTDVARDHSQDMLDNDFFEHNNLTGQSPFDRMEAAGYTLSRAAENLAFQGTTATLTESIINTFVDRMHENLFVDEGVVGRGHRINMLNGDLKEVGTGIQLGEFTNTEGNTFNGTMATQDFGTQQNAGSFLLGVIYDDTDNNSFYTPGEGVGEVEISILNTTTNATQTIYSMDAGGYQVELNAGTYDITFASGANTHFIDDLVIGVNNVKSDWVV